MSIMLLKWQFKVSMLEHLLLSVIIYSHFEIVCCKKELNRAICSDRVIQQKSINRMGQRFQKLYNSS